MKATIAVGVHVFGKASLVAVSSTIITLAFGGRGRPQVFSNSLVGVGKSADPASDRLQVIARPSAFTSFPYTLHDRRTSIDIIVLREGIARLKAQVRWIPADRTLADALTKESAEAFDLLRSREESKEIICGKA